MSTFNLPTETDLTPENQEIFKQLHSIYGKVPNIFASFASSENGLKAYFEFISQKNSLTNEEKEVVNLIVSQVNKCPYCLSFHTAVAKNIGLTDHQILDIRANDIQFNHKLRALGNLAHNIAITKGQIVGDLLEDFYEAGYNQGHLVDVVLAIGNISTLNLLYAITKIPIDWPEVAVNESI